jgi:DNA polymerase-3 subunit beta
MKLTILQESFSKVLNNAQRFTSNRAQLPILGNIHLSAEKTKLVVSSTNLEISLSTSVGAKIEKEGEITVPSKTISEVVNNLPAGPIQIEEEKEQIKITTSSFKSTLSGMNASDFPKIPKNLKEAVVFPKEAFLEALSQVSFASSVDETRPILTGVLMLFKKDSLVLVATDGFRLSQKRIKTEKTPEGESVVVPKNILVEVARIGAEANEICFSLNKKENQIIFGLDDAILSSRTLEGEFPNFEKIIPKESGIKITLDKEELLRGVKLASVFARENANIVKFLIKKDALAVFAESSSSGKQETEIEAKIEAEKSPKDFEIAFNYRFLEEFLHSVKGEEIKIELNDSSSPGIFMDTKNSDYLHLIMPVRVQG